MTRRDVEQIMKEQQKLLADINYSDLHTFHKTCCALWQIADGNTIFVWITDNGTAAMTPRWLLPINPTAKWRAGQHCYTSG